MGRVGRAEGGSRGPLTAALVCIVVGIAEVAGAQPDPGAEANRVRVADAGTAAANGQEAAGKKSSSPAAARISSLAQKGRKLVERYQCARCHEGVGLEPVAMEESCVQCHQLILADQYPAPSFMLDEWKPHLVSLVDIPSLNGTARFRREWLEQYLMNPEDLRPNLPSSMPRMPISRADAKAIATWLIERESAESGAGTGKGAEGEAGAKERRPVKGAKLAALEGADAAAGRKLLETRGCAICHSFTGVDPVSPSMLPVPIDGAQLLRARTLAPDLRTARERFEPAALIDWLQHPRSSKPDSAMPEIPLTAGEARDIVAYLFNTPLTVTPAPVAKRLPVLERKVTFEEVSTRVLIKYCNPCHEGEESPVGMSGPGNVGGFGYRPRKLVLSSYEGIVAGGVDDKGKPRSVFSPMKDGTPRLLAHLVARQAEEAGRPRRDLVGMPLGLPALSLEEIQLVESWIAQGHPK